MPRRYDIDWLRVIAIGFLIIYHVAIGFQPWGGMIGFITSPKQWPALWFPMTMLNVWRIPLLFFVSGMGLYFSMQRRTWPALIRERSLRILLPFVFGVFCIVPLHLLIWRYHFGLSPKYIWDMGHLWFLANIFIYVIVLSPIFYFFKKSGESKLIVNSKKWITGPWLLILIAGFLVLEVILMKPNPFEVYARTWHGFVLGLICFLSGYLMVLAGKPLQDKLEKWAWLFLVLSITLFLLRTYGSYPGYLIGLESFAWILTLFGFAGKYLQKGSAALTYLSQAAYPVYILHMIFLYLGAHFIFPMNTGAPIQFILQVLFTLGSCLLSFEVIRRIKVLRVFFGIKW